MTQQLYDVAPATFSFRQMHQVVQDHIPLTGTLAMTAMKVMKKASSHTFNEAGNYKVTLTATDSNGETASDALEIAVEEPVDENHQQQIPLTAEIISNDTARC